MRGLGADGVAVACPRLGAPHRRCGRARTLVEHVVGGPAAVLPGTADRAGGGQRSPAAIVTGATGSSCWSRTSTPQPPAGAGPAVATSPPSATSTPVPQARATSAALQSAAQALAVAPKSSLVPAGTVRVSPSMRTGACGLGCGQERPERPTAHQHDVAVIARGVKAVPRVGSTSPSGRAASSAVATSSARTGLTRTGVPSPGSSAISESARKRLHAIST
jgi:hypothetical protein